jgi:chemotaxis protein MotA
MFFIVGAIVVLGSVFGGYSIHGNLSVLWQPIEFVIILGGGLGAFVIANPSAVITGAGKSFQTLIKGPRYTKEHYLELLSVLYSTFKLAKSNGDLALERHVENPNDSKLFGAYPKFHSNHHAVEFFCDYLRLLTLGANNPHEIESVMDEELDIHHAETTSISSSFQVFADAVPALGIVAAVLGVIVTMSSITEPPEILGGLIAAALVGTFFGIFMSYGLLSPIASNLSATYVADAHYLQCIKVALVGHMQGYAPQVSVEFARKTLASNMRPSFSEVEKMVQNIPAVG